MELKLTKPIEKLLIKFIFQAFNVYHTTYPKFIFTFFFFKKKKKNNKNNNNNNNNNKI